MNMLNIYRLPLPSPSISLSSEKGKLLFKEAMLSGHTENFFRLFGQLHTQEEPFFCGLANIVMCLNTLEVDPGRIWKTQYRWFDEQMIHCCIPLDFIKENGITLDQFVSIAKCNGLTADLKRMSDAQRIEDFKNSILRITKKDDEILVVSYSRASLGQAGDGHFATIGGYNKDKEMVLLLDTARFKYPSHWVPISSIWEAMFAIDEVTGGTRGYVIVTKEMNSSLMSTSVHLNEYLATRAYNAPFSEIIQHWTEWLDQTVSNNSEIDILSMVSNAVQLILDNHLAVLESGGEALFPLTCVTEFIDITDDLESTLNTVVKEIVGCKVGVEVSSVIGQLNSEKLNLLCENLFLISEFENFSLLMLQDTRMKLTFLITSWLLISAPINNNTDPIKGHTRRTLLHELAIGTISTELSPLSQAELTQLTKKLAKMQTCREEVMCCGIPRKDNTI